MSDSYNPDEDDFFDDYYDEDNNYYYDYDDDEEDDDFDWEVPEVNSEYDISDLMEKVEYVYDYKYTDKEREMEEEYGSCSSIDYVNKALRVLSNTAINKPEFSNVVFEKFRDTSIHPYFIWQELDYICKNKPELTETAFEIFKQTDKIDYDSIRCIVKNNRNLVDKALEIPIKEFTFTSIRYLNDFIENAPNLADKILDKINDTANNNNISNYDIYPLLTKIIKSKPELADKALNTFNNLINNKNSIDSFLSITYACRELTEIAKDKPEFVNQSFDIFNEIIQSDKSNNHNLKNASEILYDFIKNAPNLANRAFDTYKTLIKSKKFDSNNLIHTYANLSDIIKNNPSLTNQAFDVFKTAVKSERNDSESLNKAYVNLSEIMNNKPELTSQVLDVVKEAIKSDKNNSDSLHEAYSILFNILQNKPELTSQVLDTVKEDIKSKKGNSYNLRNAYTLLSAIAENKPEFAKQAFDIAKKDFPCEDISIARHQYFILSRCMKSKDAKDFVEKATKYKEELQSCYNMRFSTRKECFHLLENYTINQISKMNMSAQHRCTNVLISQLAKAQNIDKDKALDYRTNPQNTLYNNNADWLIPASIKAAELFGCWFPSYIKQTQPYLNAHDSVYWIPKGMGEEKNASFVSFVQRNLIYDANGEKKVRPLAEMEIIARAWKTLSNEEEKLKYREILSICQSIKYKDVEHRSFAIEASKWGISDCTYKNFEDIYAAGLNVPEPFDSSKEFKFGKYCGKFLPRDDVRVGFFGNYTNCCQHFDGVGKDCAISTVKDPYSQLFVIEDESGKIIAGSWVWENKEGTHRDVCFDNIEALGDFVKHPMLNKIYRMAGRYLTDEANCRKVTIGMGYQDADTSQYAQTSSVALPKQYGYKYSDAKGTQVLLCENPNATPLDKKTESICFVRKSCFLDMDEMDRISEQCFPQGDQRLQTPDRLTGLALVDESKGVVGYCLYDKDKKSIYDMAVLPEYRTDKQASSTKLLTALIKDIRDIGGTWSAELRDKTTYRYLEAMQKRGLVSFETNGVDHTMSDGSVVYAVNFKVNTSQKDNLHSKQHPQDVRN